MSTTTRSFTCSTTSTLSTHKVKTRVAKVRHVLLHLFFGLILISAVAVEFAQAQDNQENQQAASPSSVSPEATVVVEAVGLKNAIKDEVNNAMHKLRQLRRQTSTDGSNRQQVVTGYVLDKVLSFSNYLDLAARVINSTTTQLKDNIKNETLAMPNKSGSNNSGDTATTARIGGESEPKRRQTPFASPSALLPSMATTITSYALGLLPGQHFSVVLRGSGNSASAISGLVHCISI